MATNDSIVKTQSPLKYQGQGFYPLTTADQVILNDNSRLNYVLNNLVYTEEQDGNIKTLFADSAKTETLFPRTNIDAVSDDVGTTLTVLLSDLNINIGTKQEKHKPISASLSLSNWSNMKQTISVSNVTASNTVVVTPAPSSHASYCEAGVYCSAQASGTLTFTCSETPTANMTVNILILN